MRNELALTRNPQNQVPPPMQLGLDASPRLHTALLTYRLPEAALSEFIEKFRIRKEYRDLMFEIAALSRRVSSLERNDVKSSEIVVVLEDSSDEARLLLRVVTESWLVRHHLDQYQRRLRNVHSLLNGDDLQHMGIPRGPIYRKILQQLRAARLDGGISTRTEEEALVRRMLSEGEDTDGGA
jgi:hypothetical protein